MSQARKAQLHEAKGGRGNAKEFRRYAVEISALPCGYFGVTPEENSALSQQFLPPNFAN